MPATRNRQQQPPEQSKGSEQTSAVPPNGGAWEQDDGGTWTWHRGATPEPELVSQWGYQALTDIRRDPLGNRNYGAWTPQHGGGWHWDWGRKPSQTLVDRYGEDVLTDPDHLPGHSHSATDNNQPPPPDVNPPTLADSWHGVVPDVTGAVPRPPDTGDAPTVTTPPVHQAYTVSPGAIRQAEQVVLSNIDIQLFAYDALKSKVAASKGEFTYMARERETLINNQDRLLLQVGDTLELAGQFVRALNNAAQLYARADLDSFVPET
ncbi:hypothetical protein [Plantactinospora sp. KBS50]|uniref:hypothetical protein n=1 Tax=Plantactinospora sp. KBS50 TaxID=2024580 RepID=UPI000BAAAF86|nr:hypothetical protein [Plantactinospora sp. KBS50]ASW55415.1 hypothetical protein CIK06_16420 [Plantactinospora sp. KBS50]